MQLGISLRLSSSQNPEQFCTRYSNSENIEILIGVM